MIAAAIILLIAIGCGILQEFQKMWTFIAIAALVLILRFFI